MPRRPRIKLAGIPQHLVQRGVNREPCFFAEEDCHCYLHWLQEAADDWRCVVHAYALMTNHVHLLVTTGTADGPARLMQSLGRRYVQYINRHYKRSGTLWEGRYKSSAVQAEDYLLACQRYIELNPVRADMVADPGQYRWSSYRRLALGQPDRLVTPHPLYLALGRDEACRQTAYRALFRSQLDAEALADIRLAIAQGQPLGNDRFKEAVCAATGVRRAQAQRGRPLRTEDGLGAGEEQTDFGF
jgi:putative transposase